MDKSKIVGLIFEFFLAAIVLSALWDFAGEPFSYVRTIFGGIFGMLAARAFKWGWRKFQAPKTPH